MKRLAALLLPLLLACNANPLLTDASANYAPMGVGAVWTFSLPGGGGPYVSSVSSKALFQGRDSYQVDSTLGGAPAGTEHWSFIGGDWYAWDATLGWVLYRRLPYVTGNSWYSPTTVTTDTVITYVEGPEKVVVPAGYFGSCFKLRRETFSYVGGVTTTAQELRWVAPGIGDVKVSQLDALGAETVLGELSSYQAP
jgi:hypothetical protein